MFPSCFFARQVLLFLFKKTQDKTAVVAKIEISTEAESIDSLYYFQEKVRSYIF